MTKFFPYAALAFAGLALTVLTPHDAEAQGTDVGAIDAEAVRSELKAQGAMVELDALSS